MFITVKVGLLSYKFEYPWSFIFSQVPGTKQNGAIYWVVGCKLQAVKTFQILKIANHKRDLERVLWRSRQIFLWRVLFSIFKSFHCLQLHPTTQKWLHFILYQGLQGVSLMFEGKVFCGEFYFQVFMSCWRIQQSVMNIFCSLW